MNHFAQAAVPSIEEAEQLKYDVVEAMALALLEELRRSRSTVGDSGKAGGRTAAQGWEILAMSLIELAGQTSFRARCALDVVMRVAQTSCELLRVPAGGRASLMRVLCAGQDAAKRRAEGRVPANFGRYVDSDREEVLRAVMKGILLSYIQADNLLSDVPANNRKLVHQQLKRTLKVAHSAVALLRVVDGGSMECSIWSMLEVCAYKERAKLPGPRKDMVLLRGIEAARRHIEQGVDIAGYLAGDAGTGAGTAQASATAASAECCPA